MSFRFSLRDQNLKTFIGGPLLAVALGGCSAGSGSDGRGLFQNGGGSTNEGSGGAVNSSGGTISGGGDNVGGFITIESGGTTAGGGGGGVQEGCGIVQKPEEIIQYSPVGLFIMQDRSGSMVTGFPPPASPDGWNNSTAAVTAFVNDPSSAGLSVGLGSFPPMTGDPDCAAGANCGTPIVPIAELPGNAPAMVSGMQSATPNNPIAFTPTECGLRGMVSECQRYKAASGIQCVGVLVTDGTPTQCDGNAANLEKIVSDAKAQGMDTFVIAMPGSNLQALDGLARAGGTNAAIDVAGGATAFIAALNSIRGQVSVGTALPCEWKIPPPPQGQTFDPNKVNISFTPKGEAARDFGYVPVADCPRATDGWYFDDPANPTRALVCPSTCDMVKTSSGAAIAVSFGCARKPAKIQ